MLKSVSGLRNRSVAPTDQVNVAGFPPKLAFTKQNFSMASTSLPQNPGLLIQLGGKMENGINAVGASVPVTMTMTMTTAKKMHDDTQAFLVADNNFNAGRSTLQTASDTYQATLDLLYTWLLNVSNMLANRFGTRWNTQWAQAGFINNTTGIPTRIASRVTLAQRLVDFSPRIRATRCLQWG